MVSQIIWGYIIVCMGGADTATNGNKNLLPWDQYQIERH